jgi:hypothetical protein
VQADHEAQPFFKHVFVCGMSRSGTTLLTTILDSHPRVSMAYELLPVGLPSVQGVIDAITATKASAGNSVEAVIESLEEKGHESLATFVMRCDRALVSPDDLISICRDFLGQGIVVFDGMEMRTRLSLAVAEAKRAKEGGQISGFKVNFPSVELVLEVVSDAYFVYIVRDPRDVVASHFAANFGRSIEEITRAWEGYLTKFKAFAQLHPGSASIVRYEDLVTFPQATLREMFQPLGLDLHRDVMGFSSSKASVHSRGEHPNSARLRAGFSPSSVSRWHTDLSWQQVDQIQQACGQQVVMGYPLVSDDHPAPLDRALLDQKSAAFGRRDKYFRNEYAKLLDPYRDLANLTWHEAALGETGAGSDILIVRHDVDHDYESALRMARWEQKEGIRSTYCILHSAWYYGWIVDGRIRHSTEMLECCIELQALGHEISFHNNVVAVSLLEGLDPYALLEEELWFLRSHGIRVTGSATHGDKLCHELNFRNFELFRECVYESRGGERRVSHLGNSVDLGRVSMARFGLIYEAYDLPRDVYITDSGGHLRMKRDTPGRGGKRRSELDNPPSYPTIVGILAHPCWWDFGKESTRAFASPVSTAGAEH